MRSVFKSLTVGKDHRLQNKLCEDFIKDSSDKDHTCVVICDGAGFSPYAKDASEIVCDIVSKFLLNEINPNLPNRGTYYRTMLANNLESVLGKEAEKRGIDQSLLASTFIGLLIVGNRLFCVHLGDGNVKQLSKNGELSSISTAFKAPPYATVLTGNNLKDMPNLIQYVEGTIDAEDEIILFSDGFDKDLPITKDGEIDMDAVKECFDSAEDDCSFVIIGKEEKMDRGNLDIIEKYGTEEYTRNGIPCFLQTRNKQTNDNDSYSKKKIDDNYLQEQKRGKMVLSILTPRKEKLDTIDVSFGEIVTESKFLKQEGNSGKNLFVIYPSGNGKDVFSIQNLSSKPLTIFRTFHIGEVEPGSKGKLMKFDEVDINVNNDWYGFRVVKTPNFVSQEEIEKSIENTSSFERMIDELNARRKKICLEHFEEMVVFYDEDDIFELRKEWDESMGEFYDKEELEREWKKLIAFMDLEEDNSEIEFDEEFFPPVKPVILAKEEMEDIINETQTDVNVKICVSGSEGEVLRTVVVPMGKQISEELFFRKEHYENLLSIFPSGEKRELIIHNLSKEEYEVEKCFIEHGKGVKIAKGSHISLVVRRKKYSFLVKKIDYDKNIGYSLSLYYDNKEKEE